MRPHIIYWLALLPKGPMLSVLQDLLSTESHNKICYLCKTFASTMCGGEQLMSNSERQDCCMITLRILIQSRAGLCGSLHGTPNGQAISLNSLNPDYRLWNILTDIVSLCNRSPQKYIVKFHKLIVQSGNGISL